MLVARWAWLARRGIDGALVVTTPRLDRGRVLIRVG
jgi:hypothetical protein